MASSSGDPDSLVTLRFHDFRVERMRHLVDSSWRRTTMPTLWGFLASLPPSCGCGLIMACSRLLLPFWDPTHCCFSVGEVDLIPTLEEYAGLLQLGQPLQRDACHTHSESSVEPSLGEVLGFDFRMELARDFIAGKEGVEEIPHQRLQDRLCRSIIPCHIVRDRAVFVLLQETGRGGPDVLAHSFLQLWFCSHLQHFYRLQTPYHFERHTVTWGPAVWIPWTHCALFDGVPLPGVWGCTGYYPSLALRQFGGVQYPPRLGDLSAVTFDYVPGEDMWRLPLQGRGYLGRPPFGDGPHRGPTIRPGASYSSVSRSLRASASTGQSKRVAVLERELKEARAELSSLRLARASEREESTARVESMRSTLHHNSVAVANLRRDLELRIIWRRPLTETQGQLETEQVERTRVQDELDSLRSYTQALVDPSTGRPHDIVALRRALDESEAALTSARTSIGAMRVQISVLQGDNGVLQTEVDLVHDALDSNASLAQPGRVSPWSRLFIRLTR
uniref:Aminotransferase-like plant mobile domain-containing protein n=1 Tax=Fagus sylvatica TaxID=28930 RepID=A0A2N9IXA4_FAGSY